MDNLNFTALIALGALVIIFAVFKLLFKKKKKNRRSFAHHYHEDMKFTKKEVEQMEFEQVSMDHFNAASKGLKANKLDNNREKKLMLKANPPKMGM